MQAKQITIRRSDITRSNVRSGSFGYGAVVNNCASQTSESVLTAAAAVLFDLYYRKEGEPSHDENTTAEYCTCGRRMCGNVYYSKNIRYHKYSCLGKCGQNPIRADHLEAFVLNAISECLFSSPNTKPLLDSLNAVSKEQKHRSAAEYQKLRSEQTGIEEKRDNLMRALERGKITTIITNRIEKLDQQLNQVDAKIRSLSRDPHVFKAEDMQALQDKFQAYLQGIDTINNVTFLRSVLDRIVVGEDTVTIRLKNGIAIDKSTKIHLKGNDTMYTTVPQKTYKAYDAILLAISEYVQTVLYPFTYS